MTKRPKSKPKSPEQIAAERILRRARDLESVGLQPEAAILATAETIEVRRVGQANVAGARRFDAFDALREGMAVGAYDAARRLEGDLRLRRGEADRGPMLTRVDVEAGQNDMDRRLAAGERVDAALARIGIRDGWLLVELIYPTIDLGDWRRTVAYVTGEANPVAQAAAVRSACANLAAAYEHTTLRAA